MSKHCLATTEPSFNSAWLLVALAIAGALAGCNWLAVASAPSKKPVKERTAKAVQADSLFWRTLHGGDYEHIPDALDTLTAAYLETPADAVTAAHIAWLHIWRIGESARLASAPATITDDAVLARKYFQEAVRLDPSDARYLGFLGGTTLMEANIHQDAKLTRQGYYTLRSASKAWPEFNLFTGGYVMSRQPAESPRFREGLEWEWRNLDVCVGEKIDRQNPDYAKYMHLSTTQGRKRVCWNSWIAPHNLEGFFLNMGDMLVKAGDVRTAKKIYANARLTPEFRTWRYAGVLEARIRDAEANVAAFNTPKGRTMISSEFSCMACHQR
jgi:hypothetical protein